MTDATVSAQIQQKRQRGAYTQEQASSQTKRNMESQDMSVIDQYTGIKGVTRLTLREPPVKEECDQVAYQRCSVSVAKMLNRIETLRA